MRCPTSAFGDEARWHLSTAATRSARSLCRWQRSHRSPPENEKSPLGNPRATKLTRYHLSSQHTLPQNALTGAPETAYLSTVWLRDHVLPSLTVPTLTLLGSLTDRWGILFPSQPFQYTCHYSPKWIDLSIRSSIIVYLPWSAASPRRWQRYRRSAYPRS